MKKPIKIEIKIKTDSHYYKELIPNVIKEINKKIKNLFNIKEEKIYNKGKFYNKLDEIVKEIINFYLENIRKGLLIEDIKINKIKRTWNENKYSITFEYLTKEIKNKEKVSIELKDYSFKKEKKFEVSFILKMEIK